MTKWIVWLLLLANLALFGWMRWGSLLTVNTDAGSTQPELHPEKIRVLDALPASAAAPTSGGMSLALSPVSAAAATAVAEPAPAPVPTHMPAPASIPIHVPVAGTPPDNVSKCAEWGEFSGEDLLRAQQALSLMKLGDNLSQRTVERNHGFWVYIPPMKKRSSVEKKIAQLKERGIKDYFVIQEKGKWQNAISLGVFKTKDAAEKFIAVLRTKDVRTARLGERVSKLKYTVFVVNDLDSGTADKLSALQKEFPDSELKLSACNN